MRGKHHTLIHDGASVRLIPAYAGKTVSPMVDAPRGWAHPRVCGENSRKCVHLMMLSGSSPRMRGKPGRPSRRRLPKGLIPAYAGKTLANAFGDGTYRAHPRVCGENQGIAQFMPLTWGSSPRMRGKRLGIRTYLTRFRLIPAYAGKTRVNNASTNRVRAHPRVCGENRVFRGVALVVGGSSPRMRGKLPYSSPSSSMTGLIPAYAGKTGMVARIDALTRAHPRVCGENIISACGVFFIRGSSPRMRGKPPPPLVANLQGRLIPAYAGKTEDD